MKKKLLSLFFVIFCFGFVLGQPEGNTTIFQQEDEFILHLETILNQADGTGYNEVKGTLSTILDNSKKTGDKNLIARSNYALARLNFKFGKLALAEKNLQKVWKSIDELTDQYLLLSSYILQTNIDLQNNKLVQAESNLSAATKIMSNIDELKRKERSIPKRISFVPVDNSTQQRPLKFEQLTIILGVSIILALSLLSIAIFKYTKMKTKSTSLLLAKNKQLTKEKNKAEKAILVKNQFLSTITHELRTPIYAVTGLTHLLYQGNPTEEQKEYLNSLQFSGEHLLSLINNILDINKLEANKVEPQTSSFVLKEKIDNVLRALSKSISDQNNNIHLELDDSLPERVIGDYVKLSQVMINLISNANRFTKDGDIWVRIKLVNASATHVSIYFEIEDNGIGISEAKKEEIFHVFTQGSNDTNNKYGGTGLGLPIVKGIIRILGGKIKLESTLDVGSKFYFTLKFEQVKNASVSEAQLQQEKEANLNHWQKALKGKKVLIVEDNKINQMITQKILSKYHVVCDLANDGETALEKTRTNVYDLILMDIHMPGISGIEATKEIRETDLKTPIIALTAVALDEAEQVYLIKGFNDMIPKPYKVSVFFQKIYDALYPSTNT